MSFSFSTARRVLPEESCPIKTCPTRLARLSPIRKQKPDSSPQPAPTSQGSCVLVCQEVIPDGNSCDEHSFGTPGGIIVFQILHVRKKNHKLGKENPKEGLLQMAEQSENPSSPSGQVVSDSRLHLKDHMEREPMKSYRLQ
ncbi:hypothetical protein TB2_023954 [Malus domestica]